MFNWVKSFFGKEVKEKPYRVLSSPKTTSSKINKNEKYKPIQKDDGDFATSMVVGMVTNNAAIGMMAGGSLVGGIAGDMLNDGCIGPCDSPSSDSSSDSSSSDYSFSDSSCDSGSW